MADTNMQSLMQGVGVTAEMAILYFKAFVSVGFSDDQALELTKNQLQTILLMGQAQNHNQEMQNKLDRMADPLFDPDNPDG